MVLYGKNESARGIKRVVLWGGVQGDNHKAISFYKKHGFRTFGVLERNGLNYDMLLEIH